MYTFIIAAFMYLLGSITGVIIMAVLYIGKKTDRKIKFKNKDSDL